jgi:AmmeMemoRadiSam system protein A
MFNENRDSHSPIVLLALFSIRKFVLKKERLCLTGYESGFSEFNYKAGVFVSIKKDGALRGCIGTIEPTCANVKEEVIQNAISSASRDPRFPMVSPDELDKLVVNVDVLTASEKIKDESFLDPGRYGLIVSSGFKRGLLLPALEGVSSVKEQIEICKMKGGIGSDEKVELSRFEVKRYK